MVREISFPFLRTPMYLVPMVLLVSRFVMGWELVMRSVTLYRDVLFLAVLTI